MQRGVRNVSEKSNCISQSTYIFFNSFNPPLCDFHIPTNHRSLNGESLQKRENSCYIFAQRSTENQKGVCAIERDDGQYENRRVNGMV